jgi:hypothetical protein
MLSKLLTEMGSDEFQALMDDYIARSAERDDAIPASTLWCKGKRSGSFLEMLFDLLEQRASSVVQLEGQIVNGELVLTPTEEAAPVQVQGNRILLGDLQVVVSLKDNALQPA